MRNYWLAFIIGMMFISCMQQNREKTVSSEFTGKEGEVKLIVLAPGHFHANLLQKSSIPQVISFHFVEFSALLLNDSISLSY